MNLSSPLEVANSFQALSLAEPPSCSIEKSTTVRNAHNDDVHGMIQLSSDTFVSGSKDGCLKLHDIKARASRSVQQKERIDYKKWITALTPAGDNHWLSGTRDGTVTLWENSGEFVRKLNVAPPNVQRSGTSKPRNLERVNCLTASVPKPNNVIYYVGRPTHFSVHSIDLISGKERNLGFHETSKNDWVYCLNELLPFRMLVTTGDKLEIWARDGRRWEFSRSLINPGRAGRGEQRPFISSVKPLSHAPESSFGLAVFDGSVRSIDVESGKTTFHAQEHKGRVWTIENIFEHIFASCSDDHTIKVWDLRDPKKSQLTIGGNIGRVSSILKLSDSKMVSASCPDDLRKTEERAQLTFWDIRKTEEA